MKKLFLLICLSLISIFSFSQWSWQNPKIPPGQIRSVSFVNDNTGYAAGIDGGIMKTTNGGESWSTLFSRTFETFYSVYFTDELTGYCVGSSEIIIKTIDGGISWSTLSIGNPFSYSSVWFTDANIGYIVDEGYTEGSILLTINGGETWTVLESGTPEDLYSVCFTGDGTGYAAGHAGTILKTTNGGIVGFGEPALPESRINLYPNPPGQKINIANNDRLQGETFISVFNMNSEQVMQGRFHDQTQVEMDVSTLAQGIYLVKIQTREGVESKKLVIK